MNALPMTVRPDDDITDSLKPGPLQAALRARARIARRDSNTYNHRHAATNQED